MFRIAKFGFKNYKHLTRTNSAIINITPFYFLLKLLNSSLVRYQMPNHFKTHIVNRLSMIRKTSRRNSVFFPSTILLSFTLPFFGPKSEEKELEDKVLMNMIRRAIFGEKEEEDEESKLIIMMKRAILAMQRGEPAIAEQLLHLALKAAQELDEQRAVTYIYDLMANFALQNGEYKKAETLFTTVLKRFLQGGMSDDDNAIVEVSLKLASIFSHLEDYEKACQGFQFCIETQEKKLKETGEEDVDEDTLVLWAMSHDWFARFLLNTRHYDRAKEHFQRAYDVCVKVKGEHDPQVAVLLNDLGSVCCLQQNYDEAIDYLNKAIKLAKHYQSEDLPSFYVNLGTIYMQKNVYDEAEQYCKRGMHLAKNNVNEDALNESQICLKTLKELRAK